MASVFERSEKRFMDAAVGERLRREIYAKGHSREIEESIDAFLGRPRSIQPFLKELGISGTS